MTEKIVTNKSITKFILPSILLMMFLSVYIVIDGVFISRYVGSLALAGQNIVSPLYSVALGVGIMFATGGSALIAINIGKGKIQEASLNFTTLLIAGFVIGIFSTIICLIFKDSIITMLGGEGELHSYGSSYSTYIIIAFPFLINKVIFESILRVEGSPNTALFMTVIGGVLNIIFDYIFMSVFSMGIAGAGLGTLLGIIFSTFIGYGYFTSKKAMLKLKISKPNIKFLLKTIINGSSEMVNEAAIALTTFVYNMLMLKHIGEYGVAAITIIIGINMLITSVFMGFSLGVAPLISYNYGAKNNDNIKKILIYAKKFILTASIVTFIVGYFTAKPLVSIYINNTTPVFDLAVIGLKLFSISFLFAGINIFGSAFFTAFGNGKVSALISFLKSFVFFIIAAFILPTLFKTYGIWLIQPIAECLSIVTVIYFIKKYGYKINDKTQIQLINNTSLD